MTREHKPTPPELTRPFRAADVLGDDREIIVTADKSECAALARRFGFVEITDLKAVILLTPWRGKGVRARGVLSAHIVQSCSLTLEPVTETVDENLEALFWPDELADKLADDGRRGEAFLDLDQEEIPETFEDGSLDLGELTAEWLAVSANAYPRAEGAELPGTASGGEAAASDSPFRALSRLKPGGE